MALSFFPRTGVEEFFPVSPQWLDSVLILQYHNIMKLDGNLSVKKVAVGARCLRVLGHPVRIHLLEILTEGEQSVGVLAEALGVSQSNVSQHLAILRDKGILADRRSGHQVFYRLADSRIPAFFTLMKEIFCR
jgi:ArsR family transcriptional regulator